MTFRDVGRFKICPNCPNPLYVLIQYSIFANKVSNTQVPDLRLFFAFLKEMEKFVWEGREKSLPNWLSQFSCSWNCRENYKRRTRAEPYSIVVVFIVHYSMNNLLSYGG